MIDILNSGKPVPRRDMETESRASANGEVITRKMSQEEMEQYFSEVKPVTDRYGQRRKAPMIIS